MSEKPNKVLRYDPEASIGQDVYMECYPTGEYVKYEEYVKLQEECIKLRKAVELADGIMSYCGGDSWERECTQDDREEYRAIVKELGIESNV